MSSVFLPSLNPCTSLLFCQRLSHSLHREHSSCPLYFLTIWPLRYLSLFQSSLANHFHCLSPGFLPISTYSPLHHSALKSHISLSYSIYKLLFFTHPLYFPSASLNLLLELTETSSPLIPQFSISFLPISIPYTTSLDSFLRACYISCSPTCPTVCISV